ncbi:rhodanese-like domain-containing protein [Chloroflexota bacterium]
MKKGLLLTLSLVLTFIMLHMGCELTPISTPAPTATPPVAELPPSSYLSEIPRISAEEVKAKSDVGVNLVIIDSRSEAGYAQSHILGAISIPESVMAEPYSDLDRYDEIITYCS